MIYALTILVFLLIIAGIKTAIDKKKITEERDKAQAKVEVLEEDVKILKYNYISLKKVYTGMLKKHAALKKVYASTLKKHNVLDIKLKKIEKIQNYRKK